MSDRSVELRSDTFTRPTAGMRQAMASAEVGDDVWNEDPTVQRLERRAAELMGKEAALFVSSGTQGNLVGILSHTQRGQEIILGDESHIFQYEAAGTAVVGALQVRTVPNTARGGMQVEDIRAAIRGSDIHEPPTGCLALENTHNRCGGAVIPPSELAAMAAVAGERGVPVHLDGARIFNAAISLGVSPAELTAPVDSITFCLSKALGAPIGSLLCGSSEYIDRARRWRKVLGGGMRQVGILAAAGLYALDNHVERLAEDHANARRLAEGLAEIRGIDIDPDAVESNIVFFDIAGAGVEPAEFLGQLVERGVRVAGGGTRLRAVTSYEVSREDIEFALMTINRAVATPAAVSA